MLGLILARGGSKGVPKKNIKKLLGKPLIAYTIEAALESNCFDHLVLSTDCEEIAKVSLALGAEVPFMRPPELAGDNAKSIDAIIHALDQLGSNNRTYKDVFLLQPTSPLRTKEDIVKACSIYKNKNADALVSITESIHNPATCFKLAPENMLDFELMKKIANINRQDLTASYKINGAIYIANEKKLRKNKSLILPRTYTYLMGRDKSIDIDEELDFSIAEMILKKQQI